MTRGILLWLLFLASHAGSQRPTSTGGKERHDVYIAGFFPFARNVPESRVGRGVMPSVKLAVDHINENQAVLRNYRLHMWWNDTQVSSNLDKLLQLPLFQIKECFDNSILGWGVNTLHLFGTTASSYDKLHFD